MQIYSRATLWDRTVTVPRTSGYHGGRRHGLGGEKMFFSPSMHICIYMYIRKIYVCLYIYDTSNRTCAVWRGHGGRRRMRVLAECNLNAVALWLNPYSNQWIPYRNPAALAHRMDPLQAMRWQRNGTQVRAPSKDTKKIPVLGGGPGLWTVLFPPHLLKRVGVVGQCGGIPVR